MKKVPKLSQLKLSILLPVRNEGINIRLMLKILEVILEIPHEVLIIYDNQKDETIPVIKKMRNKYPNIKPILNTYGKGVINAIKAGVDFATGKYILILAVDDVGPTLAIEDMVDLMDQGCEFISCTRYKFGGRRLGGSIVEAAVSKFGNSLFSFISGSSFSDSTTGFKMFQKDIFNKISLESKPIGWAVVFEMAVKAQAAGFKLGEVPIISVDRLYGGKSSFRLSPWFKEYFRWFVWGFFHLLGKRSKLKIKIPATTII